VSLRVGTWCSGTVEDALTTHKNFMERMGEEVVFLHVSPWEYVFLFCISFSSTNYMYYIKKEGNIKNNQGKSLYNNVSKLTTKNKTKPLEQELSTTY
jgi:hypothetical protein